MDARYAGIAKGAPTAARGVGGDCCGDEVTERPNPLCGMRKLVEAGLQLGTGVQGPTCPVNVCRYTLARVVLVDDDLVLWAAGLGWGRLKGGTPRHRQEWGGVQGFLTLRLWPDHCPHRIQVHAPQWCAPEGGAAPLGLVPPCGYCALGPICCVWNVDVVASSGKDTSAERGSCMCTGKTHTHTSHTHGHITHHIHTPHPYLAPGDPHALWRPALGPCASGHRQGQPGRLGRNQRPPQCRLALWGRSEPRLLEAHIIQAHDHSDDQPRQGPLGTVGRFQSPGRQTVKIPVPMQAP